MSEQNKAAKFQTRIHPLPPVKLYQQIFCRHCDAHCNPTETRFQGKINGQKTSKSWIFWVKKEAAKNE